jgi:glyceraldehyde 3-phosphate dehydrogenase
MSPRTPLRVAINGYGRVGRALARALALRFAELGNEGEMLPVELVAINDVGDPQSLLYLSRYDSAHGGFPDDIDIRNDRLCFANQQPLLLQQPEVEKLPWGELKVDVVLETSGVWRKRDDAARHLAAGAKRVIVGAVPFDTADRFIVHGVNDADLQPDDRILSATSCTTHCIAPLLAALDTTFGIEQVLLKEIHAVTADQTPLDHVHRDPRRGRAAGHNIVPTTCSAIGAIQKILPQLAGHIDGYSVRVPTLNVALAELTLTLKQPPSSEKLNIWLTDLASRRPLQLAVSDEPLVSSDFSGRREAAIIDLTLTRQLDAMVQVCAWYDNETGYANRLLDWLGQLATSSTHLAPQG